MADDGVSPTLTELYRTAAKFGGPGTAVGALGARAAGIGGATPKFQIPPPLAHTESRFMPKVPARGIHAGKTRSGKTYNVLSMILSPYNPWDLVIWVAPKDSLKQKQLTDAQEKFGPKRFVLMPGNTKTGLTPAQEEELQDITRRANAAELQTLAILDDVYTAKSDTMVDLFTAGRHRNVSVFLLTQRIFSGNKQATTQRLNSEYIWLYDLGGVGQAETLFRQLDLTTWREATNAYKECMMRTTPGKYLLVDREAASSPDPEQRLLAYRDSSLERCFPLLAPPMRVESDSDDDVKSPPRETGTPGTSAAAAAAAVEVPPVMALQPGRTFRRGPV